MRKYLISLDAESKWSIGSIVAALVVGALVLCGWKAIVAIMAVAVAVRIACPAELPARIIRNEWRWEEQELLLDEWPADGPLPEWLEVQGGQVNFVRPFAAKPVVPADPLVADRAEIEALTLEASDAREYLRIERERMAGEVASIRVELADARAERDYWTLKSVDAANETAVALRRVEVLEKIQREAVNLRLKVSELREKLTRRRERQKARLERALEREMKAASIVPVVHSYGGIDPQSHDFLTVYSNRKDAIANGIPSYVIGRRNRNDRTGSALDTLAQELETSGYFVTPPERHAGEYLCELIASRAPSAVFQSSKPYDIAAELDCLDTEHETELMDADSFDVAALEGIR